MTEISVHAPATRRVSGIVARVLRERGIVVGLAAFFTVGGLGIANGGFFPTAWGWSSVGLFWLAAIVLLAGVPASVGRLEAALLVSIAALTGWTFLSTAWSLDVSSSVLEGERALVYVAAILAGILMLQRASGRALLVGTWAAIVVVSGYGLATRLFPEQLRSFDPISTYRLSDPLGYWNAFGVIAAIGTLLALGLAARGGPLLRCLAGGSTVVTLLALYFTFSRGGWVAFFAGLTAAVALERRRLQLITTTLLLAPWPALAIWAASRSSALTHQKASIAGAAHDGHGLAVIAIGLIVAAALAILVLDALESLVRVPQGLLRLYAGGLAFVLAAALIAVFGRYGLPPTLARKAYHAFNAPPVQQTNLNVRLLNFSGNGRTENWHTGWQEVVAHPWLGSGAGTYDVYWFQHRRVPATVHDAHNLYLETLGELGPVGLLLLAGVLGVPFIAAARARPSPLAGVAFGAYVAYVLHAAVDWDWEMPAVTLSGLFCGLALIAEAKRPGPLRLVEGRLRAGAFAATVAVAAFAVLGLLGNSAVSASSRALAADNLRKAESRARRAVQLAPWSSAPWRKLGEAEIRAGKLAAARASFRKALAKEPRDWTLWFELATASRGREQRRALAEARRLNPLSPELADFRRAAEGRG